MSAKEATVPSGKMSLEEFKKALEQGTFQDFGSVFNEQTQTSFTARTFGRVRFEPRVANLLASPLMISVPFNPLTGMMEEDGYNSRRKYRPFIRPTDFLMNIKALCDEDEGLKKRYMDYAGFNGTWDTSPTEEFTDTDRAILFRYRRPMTATHPAVRINSQAITGEKYGGQYLLNTKQNALTGEFEGEISRLHQLGLLSNAISRIELKSFNQAIQEQNADCISLDLARSFITPKTFTDIKDVDSNDAKVVRGQIRSSYPLGQVAPLAVTPFIRIPVEPITGAIKTFVPVEGGGEEEQLLPVFRNEISFEGNLLQTDKYAILDNINSIIGNAFPKDPTRKKERNVDADVYADFVILEYITDNEAASFESDADRNAAAQKMEAKKERAPLFHRKRGWADPELKNFMERLAGFYEFAARDNFNRRMPELMMSNYKPATEVIEDRAMKIFSEQFNLGGEYDGLFNADILATHPKILMELWPEEFAEKFDMIEDKLEDGESEFEKLVEASSNEENGTDDDDSNIPTDEIEI